jgi:hypothetical protein
VRVKLGAVGESRTRQVVAAYVEPLQQRLPGRVDVSDGDGA